MTHMLLALSASRLSLVNIADTAANARVRF
jgi:hypothetical protein